MKIRKVLILWICLTFTGCQNDFKKEASLCYSSSEINLVNSQELSTFSYSEKLSVQDIQNTSNNLFNLFDTSLWPARWNCGVWSEEHGWLYIFSDLGIWLAYFTIPIILGFFYLRRKTEIPFRSVFLLFIGFIVACGLTHLIDAVIFWWPAYKLSAMLRFGTALISWVTVFALVKVLPEAMELKGIEYHQNEIKNKTSELKTANQKLKHLNELFESVQSAAEIGIWEINLNDNSVYWSDAVYKIHEVEIGTPIILEKAIDYFHPDHKSIIQNAVDKAISEGIGYDLELMLITNSNNVVWTRAIGMPIASEGKIILLRGLFQDITEKINLEKKKQSINELLEKKVKQRTVELESINEELNSFSYSVSHDLRSPLRSISGFSQALKEDYYNLLDENGKNYLERISNAAIRMGKLIDDLLDLSRISRNDIVREEINLTELSENIINHFIPDPKYVIKISKNLQMMGDIKLVNILMENLIGNAIKYSSKKDNPLIEIGELIDEDKNKIIFIKDNGAGFNEEYADKLFGAFQRLHTTSEFEGSGIGLATVKRIVNMHGGTIWAKSKIDEGATFYFNINY